MTFETPAWLWALAALPVLALLEWRAIARADRAARALVGSRPAHALLGQTLPRSRRLGFALRMAALALLVLGAAGPQWGRETVRRQSQGSDLVFVVDVSASMDARDVAPSRLDEARREALGLLERVPGSRVGVLAFAGDAVRLCPLTLDHAAARLVLESLSSSSVSQAGSDLGRALREALKLLPRGRREEQAVVLWTDGEDLEGGAREVIEEVRRAGVRVFAVGVGTPAGDVVPVFDGSGQAVDVKRDEEGQVVRSRLDERLLRDLGRASRGGYFTASRAGGELPRLAAAMGSLARSSRGARLVERPVSRFAYLALLAAAALAFELARAPAGRGRPLARAARARGGAGAARAGAARRAGGGAEPVGEGRPRVRGPPLRRGRVALRAAREARRAGRAEGQPRDGARARRPRRGGRAGTGAAHRGEGIAGADGLVQPRHAARRAPRVRPRPGRAAARAGAEPGRRRCALELRTAAPPARRGARRRAAAAAGPAAAQARGAGRGREGRAGPPAAATARPRARAAAGAGRPAAAGGGRRDRDDPPAGGATAGFAAGAGAPRTPARPARARDAGTQGEGLVRSPARSGVRRALGVALGVALAALALASSPRAGGAATEVEARLSAGSVPAGGTVTLFVTVTNPSGGTGDPAFEVPEGLTLLASDRSQNFSWVNGRSTSQVQFRYELGTDRQGSYRVGPIRVRVGSTDYLSDALPLRVGPPAAALGGGGGSAPARLVVGVSPSRPFVGQLVQLSMRLVQTAELTETRAYSAPATPGFWSESWGEPIEYRGSADGRPAAITERRARLYPLAPGVATVGSASLVVSPAPSLSDRFFGGPALRPVEVRSDSVRVAVRPLPAGAPVGFENAVGAFTAAWALDRGHTAQDQAVTLRFEVRGTGNLPLLHTPKLDLPDFEVFASTVDDSFPPSGEIAPGRRRFQWTLLPRRSGRVTLDPPPFAWFDPSSESWHRAALRPLELEVLAARPGAAGADEGAFPRELAREPAAPGSRPAAAWLLALAGLLAGAATAAWRSTLGGDALSAERARQREYLRAIGLARGPDFWRAADEAAGWAESRGERVAVLRQEIAVARYGGASAGEEDVRRRLVERVSVCVAAERPRAPRRLAAVTLALLALAAGALGLPRAALEPLASRARAADAQARARQAGAAEAEWARLWDEGGATPALAARLAWAALGRDAVPEAALWVMRGRAGDARSGALAWATERVRESGGLVGAESPPLPVRDLEWGLLALALALAGALAWPRRAFVAALLALAALSAAAPPARRAAFAREPLAVVQAVVPLEGAGIELEPGQVVRLAGRERDRVRVRASRGVEGLVDAGAVRALREARP